MYQSNDFDYANLHTKSEEDLIGLGLKKFEKGLFLFPGSFFNDIPEGMVLTDVNGEKRRFHRGFDTDTRYGCLAYGVNILDPEHNKSDYDEAKTFDEYFAGYKKYDNGGELDQRIIADAKRVFETLKTPEAIQSFYKSDYETQQKMVSGLDDERSRFSCVCQNAYRYADYIKLVAKEKELATKFSKYLANHKEENFSNIDSTNRLVAARKRLAGKIDEKLGTNLSDIKLPKTIKNIEEKISKRFDKSGR